MGVLPAAILLLLINIPGSSLTFTDEPGDDYGDDYGNDGNQVYLKPSAGGISQADPPCCGGYYKCEEGEGTCRTDDDCGQGLICGKANCDWNTYKTFKKDDNCCTEPAIE